SLKSHPGRGCDVYNHQRKEPSHSLRSAMSTPRTLRSNTASDMITMALLKECEQTHGTRAINIALLLECQFGIGLVNDQQKSTERRSNEQSISICPRHLSAISECEKQEPGLQNLSLPSFLGGDCLRPALVFSASTLRPRNLLSQFPGLFPGANGPEDQCSTGQS